MIPYSYRRLPTSVVFFVLLVSLIAGCGGDGSSGHSDSPMTFVAGESLVPDCSGEACGAQDATTYKGSGVGIWRFKNEVGFADDITVAVNIANVANRSITVIYTNEAEAPVANFASFAPKPAASDLLNAALPSTLKDSQGSGAGSDTLAGEIPPPIWVAIPDAPSGFDPIPILRAAEKSPTPTIPRTQRSPPQTTALGTPYQWVVDMNGSVEPRDTTLRATFVVQNRTVRLWVENSEYAASKISDALLARLQTTVTETIYPSVTSLAGEIWGAHGYHDDLIGADQPLNLVLVNFDRNNQPLGLLGYYHDVNQFLKNGPNCKDNCKTLTNEAVVLFLDTESFYLSHQSVESVTGEDNVLLMFNTIAHEMTHMIEFYQRTVLLDTGAEEEEYLNHSPYRTFTHELPAMMMEDIMGYKLSAQYHPIRDNYHRLWLQRGAANFRCGLTTFGANCAANYYGYNATGSFGAYLLRQHGIDFFKKFLTDDESPDPMKRLDAILKQATGDESDGLARHVARWGASIALLPAVDSPKGYGFPGKDDQGYVLPAFEGKNYKNDQTFPSSQPKDLESYGFYPLFRKVKSGDIFGEAMNVPPGVSLTVVVQ